MFGIISGLKQRARDEKSQYPVDIRKEDQFDGLGLSLLLVWLDFNLNNIGNARWPCDMIQSHSVVRKC